MLTHIQTRPVLSETKAIMSPPVCHWMESIFSSPEHEVLMVSYCGQWLSVVRRRVSSVVRQHLMFTLYRPHL